MSMIIFATSLSAVGAAALTVGGLALKERWASRTKAAASEKAGPIEAFASEHAALAALAPAATAISDTPDRAANVGRFDDPVTALADISALQIQVSAPTALHSRPLNEGRAVEMTEAIHDA